MNPAQALDAFADLQGKFMIPMHFETYRLGAEPLDEPRKILHEQGKTRGISDRIIAPHIGEIVKLRG